MKFGKLIFSHGSYDLDFCNDTYLDKIAEIFDDGSSWTNWVKEELLNPESEGITGNKADVTIENNKVIIQPLFGDNPEEYAIEIDRNLLLNLIDQWQQLVNKDVPEIYIVRHENGSIEIVDKLPVKP